MQWKDIVPEQGTRPYVSGFPLGYCDRSYIMNCVHNYDHSRASEKRPYNMRHARLWVGNANKIQMEGLVNGNLPCLLQGVFVKNCSFKVKMNLKTLR